MHGMTIGSTVRQCVPTTSTYNRLQTADFVQSSSKPADETTTPPKKLSKAERRRQQYEFNKKLWEDAEAPENPYFVQKSNDVPLQSGFAPQMKLLSRRPAPVKVAKKDPVTGLEQLSIEDDKDDDEDEDRKPGQMTMEERIEKAKKEREEKQRKYDEVRQRLFGSTSAESGAPRGAGGRGTGSSSPQHQQQAPGERGGRGRGRGSAGPPKAHPGRQLFDPNMSSRGGSASSSGTNTPIEGMPMRAPRGPDGSGKGGRGFVNRGGQGTTTS